MKCEDLITLYLDSLKEKFIVEPIDIGCIIYTPYLDPSNDPISILVENIDDHFRISDMTQAMEYLFLHGLEIKPNSRQKWHQDITLNRLGISYYENELFVDVSKEKIPEGILRLTEAIKSIEDLVFTAKVRKFSDFGEEVAGYLREHDFSFERNKEFTGVSGGSIKVDFVIPRSDSPAFLYAMHSESKGSASQLTNRTIVSLRELELARYPFFSICVLDDIEGEDVWSSSYRLLKTHTNMVLFWEERDELKGALA